MGNALSCLLSEPHKISLTHKSSSTAAAAAAAASFRMTDAKGRKLVGWLVGWSTARACSDAKKSVVGARRRKMFASVTERAASFGRL